MKAVLEVGSQNPKFYVDPWDRDKDGILSFDPATDRFGVPVDFDEAIASVIVRRPYWDYYCFLTGRTACIPNTLFSGWQTFFASIVYETSSFTRACSNRKRRPGF